MGCAKIRARIDSLDDLREISKSLTREEREHFSACDDCQQLVSQSVRADGLMRQLRGVRPPAEISQNYMAGLLQRLERETRPLAQARPRMRPRFRLALAGLAIVLVSVTVWRLGDLANPAAPEENLTSDSLEYYLESFNEASSVNPIYVVKEMDYDWTEYDIPDMAQE